jgi:adenylate cyclase
VQKSLKVGSWTVDPSLNSISSEGRTVRLEPKVMGVLLCLAQHPGETLSKEQLFQAVWPNIIVTEDVLKRCIAELRRAFDDDARNPRIIETISKRGYRLVASVSALTAATAPAPTESAVTDSIAVLPFANLSPDPENEYFADGITEEIIDALAQIPELHVVARSSAFSFKGKHIDLRVVGEQLKVRTVLEGSVRRVDNRVRITAQLVGAADGFHLWSERYDREMKDVFAIQEEIAQAISRRLKLTFPWHGKPLVKPGTQNLEAYQAYVKGRALLYKRGPAIPLSLANCQRAVTLDPEYALAWAGLADAYTAHGYYALAPAQHSMPKGMDAALRAVALDPLLAEAHTALAMASLIGTWDRKVAEREFLRGMELDPKYLQARTWYALFYLQFSERQLAEGMAQAKLAVESDPLSGYAHAIYGLTCMDIGYLSEAIGACRRCLELDADNYLARLVLEESLRLSGRFEESIAAGDAALAMSGRHTWAMALRTLAFADWGKPEDADAVYCEILARARHEYVPPGALAIAASGATREEEAVRHAREALETRDPHCQFFFTPSLPASARLYTFPGFREIIEQMGRSDWLRDH